MSPESEFMFFRGRVALYAMLKSLGVGHGDQVALQAFTCVAVPEAILATGARPIWVDIAEGGVNMNLGDLAAKLSPAVKAVVVQHTFGIPVEMPAILSLCAGRSIPLIEDCCHVSDSTLCGTALGRFGVGAFWSYEWGKPVIAGLGGSATLNDADLADRVARCWEMEYTSPSAKQDAVISAQRFLHRMLYSPRRFWWVRDAFHSFSKLGIAKSNYNPVGPGVDLARDFRLRMARTSLRQLTRSQAQFQSGVENRRQQIVRYQQELTNPNLGVPTVPSFAHILYSRYPLFVDKKDELLQRARLAKLEVASWYETPVHPLRVGELEGVGYAPGSCPRAERAAASIVSLPVNDRVTTSYQTDVIRLLNEFSPA